MDIRMMTGDATSITEGFLMHGVNCQGVMGSGIALTIKTKFPKAFEEYKSLCDENKTHTGMLLGTAQIVPVGGGLYIVNGFTQDFYGKTPDTYLGQATPEAIFSCLENLSFSVSNNATIAPELKRIHMPKIGGVRGGLDFDTQVMPVIEKVAAVYPNITYVIWEYDGTLNA